MARTPSPTSVSGRLRTLLAAGTLTTREAAALFGKPSAVMSALLNQLRRRGEARQIHRGGLGRRTSNTLWGAP